WADLAAAPPVFFLGGPVSENSTAICLARIRGDATGDIWKPLVGGVGTLDVSQSPAALGVQIEEIRLFAGYAGWGMGQLEMELELGSWFILEARPVDSFTSDPQHLWKAVLGRQPGQLAWYAN